MDPIDFEQNARDAAAGKMPVGSSICVTRIGADKYRASGALINLDTMQAERIHDFGPCTLEMIQGMLKKSFVLGDAQ